MKNSHWFSALVFLLGVNLVFAESATWNLNPITGDWNTATNWIPATVPNGPTDTATFSNSGITEVSLTQDIEVATIMFEAGAAPFTVSQTSSHTLTISGAGILNNSGIEQDFVVGSLETYDYISFINSATAGSLTRFTVNPGSQSGGKGGHVWFSDNSTAGNATFVTMGGLVPGSGYGYVQFFGPASAGSGTFENKGATIAGVPGGATYVYEAVAGNATFVNHPGTVSGAIGGTTAISTQSSAENATFINNGATVAGAHGGKTAIDQESAAANAVLIANPGSNGGEGGVIDFEGAVTGDTAQVKIYGNGHLDILFLPFSLSIGSLEGDGLVNMASTGLSVGANNLSTTFAGTYAGSGLFEKIGTGTLTFSGTKVFATGPTMVSDGVLQVTHDSSLATGDVTVKSGATLRLQEGITNDYLGDGATLNLFDGSIVNLNFTGSSDRVLGLTINGVTQDPGIYGSAASSADHSLPEFTGTGTILVGPSTKSRLLNISTRLQVDTGDNVLIGGFILVNGLPKNVLIRGLGPSLADFGLSGVLMDPTLQLVNAYGDVIATNDNWRDSQQMAIIATGIPPSDDRESAIVQQLTAGTSYTAILSGKNNSTGVGLVEVYDLDQTTDSSIANISTRGYVQTGNDVMIGGIILGPDDGGSAGLIVRAIGPSLANLQVSDPLQDPVLSVRDVNGAELAMNDNWKERQENLIVSTGIPPTDDRESALLLFLLPGNYTAIVSGKDSGTGVGLVEFYNVQ